MDKAKYKAAIKLLQNPDTAPEGLVQIADLVEVDSTAYEAAQAEKAQTMNTLSELRQLNGKLSLRITEGTASTDHEETPNKPTFDTLMGNAFKEGADKQ